MKSIYLPNFETFTYSLYAYLSTKRVSKYIVEYQRLRGDLSFIEYFKLRLYHKISRYFEQKVHWIEYRIKVTEGMEKDVFWRLRKDGKYEPFDKVLNEVVPNIVRKKPPTQKVIKKKIYIHDTGKPQIDPTPPDGEKERKNEGN